MLCRRGKFHFQTEEPAVFSQLSRHCNSSACIFPTERKEEQKLLISTNIFELSLKQKLDRKDSTPGKLKKSRWWQRFFSWKTPNLQTDLELWNIEAVLPSWGGIWHILVLPRYLANPNDVRRWDKKRSFLCLVLFFTLGKTKRGKRGGKEEKRGKKEEKEGRNKLVL